MSDFIANLCSQLAAKQPISVIGGNTKAFLGGRLIDEPTSMCEHSGILSYEPTELVLTAKSGTTLAEIEHCLKDARQMLPFEPPLIRSPLCTQMCYTWGYRRSTRRHGTSSRRTCRS